MKLISVFLLLLCPGISLASEPEFSDEEISYFERKIRPLLSEHCYSCHSQTAKVLHAELRLDTPAGIVRGGGNGPLLVRGKPDESLLIAAIRYDGDVQMPPKGKLADREIQELISWVQRGAPMPPVTEDGTQPVKKIDFEAGRQFWSFQPVHEHPLPTVADTQWPEQRLDYFILEGLEREGLSPAPRADRARLIRRLSFDLTGLPPTPEEVRAFVADESPNAYENLVERLLASPHYGEKWGRMWLDLARYTDYTASWLSQAGQAHFYRDWVVRAFNEDLPYDRFVHLQLAADLMPEAQPEDLAALGMISLSPTYWKELQLPAEIIKVIVADEWEERIDAVSGTFLGLTVACARCHDHKFDPISSEDYYALAGVFASTRPVERPMIPEEEYRPARQAIEEVARLEEKVKGLKAELAKKEKEAKQSAQAEKPSEVQGDPGEAGMSPSPETEPGLDVQIDELTAKIEELKKTPHYDAPLASALSEESLYVERAGATPQDGTRLTWQPGPQDLPLFIRGDPNRPGPVVARRFLTVLSTDQKPFTQGSGRLELARAMTTEAASLTARVIVNRIWLAHFGQGLVNTPSNFGAQGGQPTHPELLDDLAARFISNGWSIKKLHREILLSATWQQDSRPGTESMGRDPSNQWLSHMNRRRLEFEPWRDAMLMTSGVLDLSIGGPSADLDQAGHRRRTLYGTVHRHEMSTTLLMHDFPDPNQHSPQRSQTTTALQGLFLLNGPLLAEQAQNLVQRLEREFPDRNADQVERAYWLLFSRPPTEQELELALEFLGDSRGEERATRWRQYAHVLFATNEFLYVE